jgi:hypothetical protein
VDAILSVGGTPSALAVKRATATIPIIFEWARDPIADSLVSSLAKPGGNVTGNADMGADLMVKRLQLLIETVGARGPMMSAKTSWDSIPADTVSARMAASEFTHVSLAP